MSDKHKEIDALEQAIIRLTKRNDELRKELEALRQLKAVLDAAKAQAVKDKS